MNEVVDELGKVKNTFKKRDNISFNIQYSLSEKIVLYTEKEERNISSNKISIVHNTNDIQNFVKQELNKKTSNKKIYYGKVNENVAKKVLDDYEIDIFEYNISLKGDNIRKIIKDHGNVETEKLRGQVAVTKNDFNHIDNIISDPDNIILSTKTNYGKPSLIFIKKIRNEYKLVEFVSDKHKTLETQTMYIHEKKNPTTTGNVNNNLSQTSETNSSTGSFNAFNISQNDVKINSDISDNSNMHNKDIYTINDDNLNKEYTIKEDYENEVTKIIVLIMDNKFKELNRTSNSLYFLI